LYLLPDEGAGFEKKQEIEDTLAAATQRGQKEAECFADNSARHPKSIPP
jgi:hypothetical protein